MHHIYSCEQATEHYLGERLMCVCDRKCREEHLQHQQKLLDQIFILGEECHAWREVSDRFPPAHMFRHIRKTDACGWGKSLQDGVKGFPETMNFWQRLKYLFRG